MSYFNYQGQQIYYQEVGAGEPCVFLHGNTASSKMFEYLLPLYTDKFKVILLDFSGNGRSQRVGAFPNDLWQDQGRQIVELCRTLNYGRVNLLGTSGGAYAAINAALAAPELFAKVVADSFDGEFLAEGFAAAILQERRQAKQDLAARQFYEWCQGEDWETVVDQDTAVLVQYEQNHTPLFSRPIKTIEVPLLITVSLEDEMLQNDVAADCALWQASNPLINYQVFAHGAHPLINSRAEEIASLVKIFLLD